MKIARQQVSKLRLTDISGLDPVEVYVEDVSEVAGKMTLTCYGKAWTAFWGNTGTATVTDFILSASPDYLASCLQRGIESTEYDPDEARAIGIRCVLNNRRQRCITAEKANQQYTEIVGFHMEDDPWQQPAILRTLLGDNWLERLPMRPNPEYVYLIKIIEVARAALLPSGTVQQQGVAHA